MLAPPQGPGGGVAAGALRSPHPDDAPPPGLPGRGRPPAPAHPRARGASPDRPEAGVRRRHGEGFRAVLDGWSGEVGALDEVRLQSVRVGVASTVA
ncbi:MAG TPA: hypothetical protein VMV22_05175, partial [Acidimicrobiales bacterium]|nr:hypothetical protein [Acidimicrobiales bacterium]